MTEQVTVSVSFNSTVPSPLQAKEKFDAKVKEISDLALEFKLDKWELQSMNYSVSAYNYGSGSDPMYQLSGSASYQTGNADLAFRMMDQLAKKNIQLSVSVSKYVGGSCESTN